MESLALLEQKVTKLISLVEKLRTENSNLITENVALKKKLTALEDDILEGAESIEVLSTEKQKTRDFLSDLISDIDRLVESGSQL